MNTQHVAGPAVPRPGHRRAHFYTWDGSADGRIDLHTFKNPDGGPETVIPPEALADAEHLQSNTGCISSEDLNAFAPGLMRVGELATQDWHYEQGYIAAAKDHFRWGVVCGICFGAVTASLVMGYASGNGLI